jgi:hypothetical protein
MIPNTDLVVLASRPMGPLIAAPAIKKQNVYYA